jgi:hypothetical protein
MNSNTLKERLAVAMLVGLMAWTGPVEAEEPTPGAIAAAKEYIVLKGGAALYDSVVPGVIEQAKTVLLQTNPMLAKELNEVALQLRADDAPKSAELLNDIARMYATRFTEQELQDLLAFYKTPLGRKVVAEEYKVIDRSMIYAQSWANKLSDQILSQMRAEMKKRGHDM